MRIAILIAALVAVGCSSEDVNRTLGARCDRTDECDDRCLVASEGYPDGFCTVDCTNSGDCPSGAECVDKVGGVCLFECSGDKNCEFLGPAWRCRTEMLRSDPTQGVMVCRGE